MLQFLFTRIMTAIPTLLLVTVLVFYLPAWCRAIRRC